MNRRTLLAAGGLSLLAVPAAAGVAVPLSPRSLTVFGAEARTERYRGRSAVRLTAPEPAGGALAVVNGTRFGDGAVEVLLAGDITPGAHPDARGFVGLAFRTSADPSRYEAFYVRMRNGRAEDQIRRNRTVQYIAMPDHPWQKLRAETPGKYESYVDVEPGVWTRVRVEVRGGRARLHVGGSPQPVLVVDRLIADEDGPSPVALWVGPMTDARFADLRIEPAG